MVNAILNGCNGAMGRVITDIVSKDDGIRIVAGVDVNPLKLAEDVYKRQTQAQASILVGVAAAVLIVAVLYWFFGTEIGSALRATGNNEDMILSLIHI